ncbi:MAG: hypothetical protein PHT95_07680 [Candidatus Omnitrophica bacterium]|nr:hypothetical protein [Candidatus Omnitrophota bacterium]
MNSNSVPRPVQFFVMSPKNFESFGLVAARGVIEGNFLLLLDEEGREVERHNMLSPSFTSLEWLDIEKRASFSRYSYGEDKKEHDRIFYGSPKYCRLKYKELGGITYNAQRPECKKCDLHGLREDVGEDPTCPGCPCSETQSCEDCIRAPECNCPQHPIYETEIYETEIAESFEESERGWS